MPGLGEERFRALLDERGVLRPGALASPERSAAYAVFAQRADAGLDLAALRAHATRFWGAKLGLTVDKRYEAMPLVDAANVVLARDDASGTRLCFGRPVEPADLEAAAAAEQAQGSHGMALLARRCPTLWLVVCEPDAFGLDRAALALAGIFAGVLLGPILAPAGDALFGVRTARSKLAR